MKQYTCPMHVDVKSSTSGVCPKCKMGLVASKDHAINNEHGHDKHAGHSVAMFDKHSAQYVQNNKRGEVI